VVSLEPYTHPNIVRVYLLKNKKDISGDNTHIYIKVVFPAQGSRLEGEYWPHETDSARTCLSV
jgi:hypothetical protein